MMSIDPSRNLRSAVRLIPLSHYLLFSCEIRYLYQKILCQVMMGFSVSQTWPGVHLRCRGFFQSPSYGIPPTTWTHWPNSVTHLIFNLKVNSDLPDYEPLFSSLNENTLFLFPHAKSGLSSRSLACLFSVGLSPNLWGLFAICCLELQIKFNYIYLE